MGITKTKRQEFVMNLCYDFSIIFSKRPQVPKDIT